MDKLLAVQADDIIDMNRAIGKFEAAAREERHRLKMKVRWGAARWRRSLACGTAALAGCRLPAILTVPPPRTLCWIWTAGRQQEGAAHWGRQSWRQSRRQNRRQEGRQRQEGLNVHCGCPYDLSSVPTLDPCCPPIFVRITA